MSSHFSNVSSLRVRTQEASILVQYGMSLKGTDVEPDKATDFLSTFVQSGQDNIHAVAKLDEETVGIDREIKQLLDQAAERKGSADGDVLVVLHSKTATTAELRLTYRTCTRLEMSIPLLLRL